VFDRFTDHARWALGHSREAADHYNHDYIGPEHVLLGLVREGTGVAMSVLTNLGVDSSLLARDVAKHMRQGRASVTLDQVPFTARARRVLELCKEEAIGLGHDYLGTEHLLLGLIREGDGIAARVLREHGVELAVARHEVRELLGEGPPWATN
jgi:ATP-dependent Clp protease ATP-binding subunit ClpC